MPTDTDTPPSTVADRLAALRDELDAIAAHEAADPLDVAADLTAWHQRAEKRSRRRVEIERHIRDLTDYGLLVDTHMPAIRDYLASTAQIRRHLHLVAEKRHSDPRHRDVFATAGRDDYRSWYSYLCKLARALPFGHPDAQLVLDREYQAWFRARDGWVFAALAHFQSYDAGHVPSPECGLDGGLPPGMRYGVYRVDEHGHPTTPAGGTSS